MTLQEIQYKAQGIIHKWRDDDSAPYIEFVEELAHMIVPEPSEDLEEAAEAEEDRVIEEVEKDDRGCPYISSTHVYNAFVRGAKWQADNAPLPEDTVLFNKGVEEGKRLMMQEAVEAEVWGEVYTSRRIVKSDWLGPEIGKPGDKVHIIIVKKD